MGNEELLEESRKELAEFLGKIEQDQRKTEEYHSHVHRRHGHHGEEKITERKEDPGEEKEKSNEEQTSSKKNDFFAEKKMEAKAPFFERSRKIRRKKWVSVLKSVGVFLLIIACLSGGVFGTILWGKKSLQKKGGDVIPHMENMANIELEEIDVLETGEVLYDGQKYRYNDEILNFVVVGVDTKGEIGSTYESHGNGIGQSDAIFLVAMDAKNKRYSVIPVNRDTMTSVEMYDSNGNYLKKATEQIALAFAYGDGKKLSAEITRNAVANLFYGIPIHGYFMLNIDAIPLLNDAVDGVEVILDEDYSDAFGSDYGKGMKVKLVGSLAERFVRTRNGIGEGYNADRMNNQKQYLTALIKKVFQKTKNDLRFPVSMYNVVSPYMITDISVSEVAYLSTLAIDIPVSDDIFIKIDGEATDGELYNEFYVDEASLYKLILDIFYEKVE